MYGYFRPKDSRLTEDERKIFTAYYCRVCYCLRILGGQAARFFTTFDMAVYSLLLNITQNKQRPSYHKCEHFATTVMHEFDNDSIGKRLANMSVIMFGEKIRDDVIDGNKFRAAGMNLLFQKTVASACSAEPEMARIAREGTDLINHYQNEKADLSTIFSVYGDMVARLFLCIDQLDEKYLRLYRSIAIWTFYIDMLHDYNKDYKSNQYNGFRIDGVPTINELFDEYYISIISMDKKITNELRQALYAINDGSAEWNILYKLIDTALSTVIIPILSTKSERRAMTLQYVNRNLNCTRVRSNFR